MKTLPPRSRQILEWRFGLTAEAELTLEAIGERLGISRERVRQIEKAAIDELKRNALLNR